MWPTLWTFTGQTSCVSGRAPYRESLRSTQSILDPRRCFSVVSAKDGIPNPYSLRKDRKDRRNTWQITLATLSLSHTSRMIKHKHQPIIPWIFPSPEKVFVDLQTRLAAFCVHWCLHPPTKSQLNSSPMAHGCRSIWWGLGVKPVWQLILHTLSQPNENCSNSQTLVSQLPIAPLILLNVALVRCLL